MQPSSTPLQSQQLPASLPLRQSLSLKKTTSNNSGASSSTLPNLTEQISATFNELHNTIDNLDSKVNLLLQKHEAEFLFAWRNHIKKIKQELYEIKEKADEKEKILNSNERLIAMEKQVIVFRDESLRLYKEVQQRKAEVQIWKRKLQDREVQVKILEEENKLLVKKTKMAEAKLIMTQQHINNLQLQLQDLGQQRPTEQVSKMKLASNADSPQELSPRMSIKLPSKTLGFQQFNLSNLKQPSIKNIQLQSKPHRFSITQKRPSQPNYINLSQAQALGSLTSYQQKCQSQKRPSFPNPKFTSTTTHLMLQPSLYQQQLKMWFLQCIKSIKKEISSRKTTFGNGSITSQITKVESIDQFKTIDKLRLLEMFLENEKLLVYMYQKIFPDRMREVEEYLVKADGKGEKKVVNNRKNGDENREDQQRGVNVSQIQLRTISNRNDQNQSKLTTQNNYAKQSNSNHLDSSVTSNDRPDSKIRVKSISRGAKSQPIRNRIIMRDGKLNLIF